MDIRLAENIAARYPPEYRPLSVSALENAGGMSGSLIWRVETGRGPLCLKAWPVETKSERLSFIHGVLRFIGDGQFRLAPIPVLSKDGESFVTADRRLWDLTPWAPGAADFFPLAKPEKLVAALRALAQFHLAGASFLPADQRRGASPNTRRRLQLLAALVAGGFDEILGSVVHPAPETLAVWAPLVAPGAELLNRVKLLAPVVSRELTGVAGAIVDLQPCIRDIHSDHVLFTGDEVTGIIDFGAMEIDNVATDVARLLGSLSRDEPAAWQMGLAAYQQIRPLSADELDLLRALNRSEALLSGVNWLKWIFVENRRFADPAAVIKRFDGITARFAMHFG